MKKSTPLSKFVLSLALLGFSVSAAEPRWFDIEVLIFKRDQLETSDDEVWDPATQRLDISPTAPLLDPLFNCSDATCSDGMVLDRLPVVIDAVGWPATGTTQRQLLGASELELNAQRQTLEQHAAFTPLLHVAWREIVAPRNQAKYYGVIAGERLPLAAAKASDEPQHHWEIEGGIKVYLQHYLFIEAQLTLNTIGEKTKSLWAAPIEMTNALTVGEIPSEDVIDPRATLEPLDSQEPQTVPDNTINATIDIDGIINNAMNDDALSEQPDVAQLISYKFDQKRRVRSGEIHYLDHPKIGMIIQIRKSPEAGLNGQQKEQAIEANATTSLAPDEPQEDDAAPLNIVPLTADQTPPADAPTSTAL
jgi:hypothetical protein